MLSRAGHTEAGCDLTRLAGLEPAAVIVEIMNDDGSMARRPDLEAFAQRHDIRIGTIADLIQYRLAREKTVEHTGQQPLSTAHGDFVLHTYEDLITGDAHLALTMGDVNGPEPTLVRVHSVDPLRDLVGADYQGRGPGPCGRHWKTWRGQDTARW